MYKILYVIPIYNGEKYLKYCIDSILKDDLSFIDLTIRFINDGSTDDTSKIIEEYIKKSDGKYRIEYIEINNSGVGKALQVGFKNIDDYDYIFRLDSDDINVYGRTIKQIRFMILNNINISGTYLELFPVTSIWRYPHDHYTIVEALKFCSSIAGPSVAFSKDVFSFIEYDDVRQSEDYLLWIKLSNIPNIVFGNIPEPLVKYRRHSQQLTKQDHGNFKKINVILLLKLLINFKISFSDKIWIIRNYLKIGSLLNRFI